MARPATRQPTSAGPLPVSAALRTRFAQAAPAVRAAASRLWLDRGLDRRYPEYLRTMHGVVRASVPLMELAARRCAALAAAGDATAGPLLEYFTEHIIEEREHDSWLLADLAALGCDPGQPVAELPPLAVARLVGPQYYWVEHYHPAALLGYIAVLEGNAPAPQLAGWIATRGGLPAAALRTVRTHAELDGGHTAAVYDLIDALPLTAGQVSAIAVSGLHTADALLRVFDHVMRPASRAGARAGAVPVPTPQHLTPQLEADQT